MTAVEVWESRGPGAGVIGDDPREISNGLGAPASPTFRFSATLTGRPQAGHFHSAPVDAVHGPQLRFASRSRRRAVYLLVNISPVGSKSTTHRYVTDLKPPQQSR